MRYDRKVKYLDYNENGARVRGSGFVKWELRNRSLKIEITVTGLSHATTVTKDVILYCGDKEIVVGRITITEGRGQYFYLCQNAENIEDTGSGYNEWRGLRIPLGENQEISCNWRPVNVITGQRAVPASNGLETVQTQKEEDKRTGIISLLGGRKRMEERENADEVKRTDEYEREGHRKAEERENADEVRRTEEYGSKEGRRRAEERESADEMRRTEEYGSREGRRRAEEWESADEMRRTEEYGSREGRRRAEEWESADEMRRTDEYRRGEGRRKAEEQQSADEMKRAEGGRIRTEGQESETSLPESKKGEVHLAERQQRQEEERKDSREFSAGQSAVRQRRAHGEGGDEKGKTERKPVAQKEDKWEQLWAIYPHIRPFRDKREYLSIGPADFVLFPSTSYRMVNNSFLLHGYYNYHHLLLTKVERRGEVYYYIGVPGNYYEREKQVAIMFGFESFECAEEPAQAGDFGYYMMRTEL